MNPKQKQEDILNLSKWEIEHILPQKGGYNNYNGWMEEQYQNKLNTLGNFVMLEKSLNIRASNEFFRKKKEEYRQSVIKEANDLLQFTDWTYQDWEKRHEEKEKLLKEYFSKLV